MKLPLRVLVVGCGTMGGSHARAYQRIPEFQIVGCDWLTRSTGTQTVNALPSAGALSIVILPSWALIKS